MASYSRVFASAVLLSALAACSIAAPRTAQQLGSINGCVRGHHDANEAAYEYVPGTGPNSTQYKSNADYRAAWDEAHATCYAEERRAPRVVPGF